MYYLAVVDHDRDFATLSINPTIANYLDITTEEGRKRLNKLLYTKYEGDSLNVLPTCDCGSLKGGYNVGVQCPQCLTVCDHAMEKPLESALWIKAPEGVRALINPVAWTILSTAMSTPSFNLLEWLCNTAYVPPGKVPDRLERYESLGIPRGLNTFVDRFDEIMDALFSIKLLVKDNQYNDTRNWIKQNRDRIFCQYIPIPSKVGFVVESTTSMSYTDRTIILAIDALRSIVSIEATKMPITGFRRQNRTVQAISALANYYKTFTSKMLGGKPGIYRKHVFGGRTHFSCRAVITSIPGAHYYGELILPWSLSLQLFRLHLVNKLLRLGYAPAQIELMFRTSAMQYSPLFAKLLKELVDESPYIGIPCTFCRNPTLARGSIQLMFITGFRDDPSDNTIGISTLALKAPNADYDGDAMNLMLINDKKMYKLLSRLEPHLGVLDLNTPRKISNNVTIPSQVITTINNWITEEVID